MSDSTALDSFIEKWRARWPEWAVAEVFVAPARRDLALAWFALLQEFEDALNIAGDPLPADAKLAWWSEELRGWAGRRSRHPLGRRLEPQPAPWAQLAEALPGLRDARVAAADTDAAFAHLRGYGEAVAAVEAVVLGGRIPADAVIARLLAARAAEAGSAALPQDLPGDADAPRLRQWAQRIRQRWPDNRDAARERRIADAFAQARLRGFARTGAPAPLPSRLRLLLTGWRAARG